MNRSNQIYNSSPRVEECEWSLDSILDDRSASNHVEWSLDSIPDDRATSNHVESSLGSILDDRSTSSHPDLARHLLLRQQRRAMKHAQERVGNSSTGSISFLELQASDAEEKESSREKFDRFNCSASTIQTDNLSSVEVDDGNEGSQYVSTKGRVEKKKSTRGRSTDPKREQTNSLVDSILMRDLNERDTKSSGDKSKATRSTKRSKSSKSSNKRGERRSKSSARRSREKVIARECSMIQ